jgi:hypothetical protein
VSDTPSRDLFFDLFSPAIRPSNAFVLFTLVSAVGFAASAGVAVGDGGLKTEELGSGGFMP